MAYSKTWDNDSPGYNAATARALNKIETEAAKMWSVGKPQTWGGEPNSGSPNHPFQSDPDSARALNTYYQNDTGYPMLVIISISALGDQPAVGNAGTGIAELEITDSGQANPYIVGAVRCEAPNLAGTGLSLGSYDFTGQLAGVVNPNEHYRIVDSSTNSGTVTIIEVQEMLMDVTYTAQTWTHQEGPNLTDKLNNYVAGVNAVHPYDGEIELVDRDSYDIQTAPNEAWPDRWGLFSGTVVHPQTTAINNNASIATVNLEDDTEGKIPISVTEGLSVSNALLAAACRIPLHFWSNANGNFNITESGNANLATAFQADRAYQYLMNDSTGEIPIFTPAQKDIYQEMIDLDDRASRGVEVLNAALSINTPTAAFNDQSTPSVTAWAVVVAHISLNTSTLAATTVELLIDGTARLQANCAASTSRQRIDVCMMALVPAGSNWELTQNNANSTVHKRTEWVIPVGAVESTFTIGDYTFNEGDGSPLVDIDRQNPGSAVSVDYFTEEDTAIEDDDFTGIPQTTMNFGTSSIQESFNLELLDNTVYVGDRQLKIKLTNASAGSSISDDTGIITIEDNNPVNSGYTTRAMKFDGVDDNYTRNSALDGISDSEFGLFAAWVMFDEEGAISAIFDIDGLNGNPNFEVYKTASDTLAGVITNNLNADIWNWETTDTYDSGVWHSILISIRSTSGNVTKQIYINDTVPTLGSSTGNTTGNIGWSGNVTDVSLGMRNSGGGGNGHHKGCIADLYLQTASFVDLDLLSNRRKIVSEENKPAFLGYYGQRVTGTKPDLFMKWENGSLVNRGTGGTFTENGVVNCPDSPDGQTYGFLGDGADELGHLDSQFFVSDATYNEGDGVIQITVSRTNARQAGSIDYSLEEISALFEEHILEDVSGTLNYLANETEKTFNVTLLDNTTYHGDLTFNTKISNASAGDSITDDTGLITIEDNDPVNSGYTTQGMKFDGVDDYYSIDPGWSNGDKGTFALCVKFDPADDGVQKIFVNKRAPIAGHNVLTIQKTAGNKIQVIARDSAGVTLVSMPSANSYTSADGWITIVASIRTDVQGQNEMYINGISDVSGGSSLSGTINYAASGNLSIGGGDGTFLSGCMADFWATPSHYTDIDILSNLRLFVDENGKPVDKGYYGQKPLGIKPSVFGKYENGDLVNRGTAGAFTINSDPQPCVDSPDGYTYTFLGDGAD